MTYQLLLTDLGKEKLATTAVVGGAAIQITNFVVGEALDVDFFARLNEQTLVNPCYQSQVDGVIADSQVNHRYEVMCVVPQSAGGFFIRELGLLDADGDLIWVGSLPSVYKPEGNSTSAVDYRIKAVVQIDNPDVQLVVDTSVVTATRAWCKETFIPKQALELFFPIGYKYWSHSDVSPKAGFDALFGYETHWRRLRGVYLIGVNEYDNNIDEPSLLVGEAGHLAHNNGANPDQYRGYTSYLWERYDPSEPPKYNGLQLYNGETTYQ